MHSQHFEYHDALELMGVGPVIPVIVIEDLAKAVPLAKALVAGGVRVLEVPLAQSLVDVRKITRMLGDTLGARHRAEALIRQMDSEF